MYVKKTLRINTFLIIIFKYLHHYRDIWKLFYFKTQYNSKLKNNNVINLTTQQMISKYYNVSY